jgi:hypothetical protein
MNFGRVKAGAGYLGGVLLATFFVVLLSYIFSFLGTIFCAALAGMMLGALPTQKWHSIPISIIFPLVIFGLLRGMKTELAGTQVLVIATICFSAFWLAYVVARALFFYEQTKPAQSDSQAQPGLGFTAVPVSETSIPRAVPGAAEACGTNGAFSLEMLQGNWLQDIHAQARVETRRLSLENENLTLSVVDSTDRIKVLARATVKLCTVDSAPTLLISEAEMPAPATTAPQHV